MDGTSVALVYLQKKLQFCIRKFRMQALVSAMNSIALCKLFSVLEYLGFQPLQFHNKRFVYLWGPCIYNGVFHLLHTDAASEKKMVWSSVCCSIFFNLVLTFHYYTFPLLCTVWWIVQSTCGIIFLLLLCYQDTPCIQPNSQQYHCNNHCIYA